MYILVILGVIISVLFAGMTGDKGGASLVPCVDIAALLLILVVVIPVMASMGMLKDLNLAFKLTLGKGKADNLPDLKRAKHAMTYMIRATLFAGTVGTLVGAIQVLAFYKEMLALTAGLGVAICPLLYAFVIAIVLLPLEARLERKIVEYMESGE